MSARDLLNGLVRLHILYHAGKEPVFGHGIKEELERHGYRLSPGTLYPLLHGLEKAGYLRSKAPSTGAGNKRSYVITQEGKQALREAKTRVWELFRELFEEDLEKGGRG